MILALLLAAAQPAMPSPDEREVSTYLICGYVDAPACPRITGTDGRVTRREWRRLLTPFPGWELQAGSFPQTACGERDSPRGERICFVAWLLSRLIEFRGTPDMLDYITDRELAPLIQAGFDLEAYPASACVPNEEDCIGRLAASQCPNGMNDLDFRRDNRGRLHVYAGCD